VVDLASGRSWRKLTGHPTTRPVDGFVAIIEGRPMAGLAVGVDGIAISPPAGRRLGGARPPRRPRVRRHAVGRRRRPHLLHVNQVHRQPLLQGGNDLRERPYALMRTPIEGAPVRLHR
jgi:hypothetical protein